jgi:hypothetical protein
MDGIKRWNNWRQYALLRWAGCDHHWAVLYIITQLLAGSQKKNSESEIWRRFAKRINNVLKIVFSCSQHELIWNDSEQIIAKHVNRFAAISGTPSWWGQADIRGKRNEELAIVHAEPSLWWVMDACTPGSSRRRLKAFSEFPFANELPGHRH